jgi:hypothetical protein
VDLAPDELLLKLAFVVALGAMPNNTLELSGERSWGSTATRFGVAIDGSRGARSFGLGAVPWKDVSSSWHDSGPSDCLKPLSKGQHIKFGVVRVKDPGFGTDLLACVGCSNGANWPARPSLPGNSARTG